jgi:hypothetical protein
MGTLSIRCRSRAYCPHTVCGPVVTVATRYGAAAVLPVDYPAGYSADLLSPLCPGGHTYESSGNAGRSKLSGGLPDL